MKRRRSRRAARPSRKAPRIRYRRSLVLKVQVLGHAIIEYLPHALDRMRQRSITRDEIVDAINHPTSTGHPTQPGRTRIRKQFPSTGRVIDVVFDELTDRVRVITTFQK